MSIFSDRLLEEILEEVEGQVAEKTKNFENKLEEKEKKIKELSDVCFDYSNAIYELLGHFGDTSSLTVEQRLILKNIKSIVDKNISDENYKEYLRLKHIDKSSYSEMLSYLATAFDNMANEATQIFVQRSLLDTTTEDDTETLIILDTKS